MAKLGSVEGRLGDGSVEYIADRFDYALRGALVAASVIYTIFHMARAWAREDRAARALLRGRGLWVAGSRDGRVRIDSTMGAEAARRASAHTVCSDSGSKTVGTRWRMRELKRDPAPRCRGAQLREKSAQTGGRGRWCAKGGSHGEDGLQTVTGLIVVARGVGRPATRITADGRARSGDGVGGGEHLRARQAAKARPCRRGHLKASRVKEKNNEKIGQVREMMDAGYCRTAESARGNTGRDNADRGNSRNAPRLPSILPPRSLQTGVPSLRKTLLQVVNYPKETLGSFFNNQDLPRFRAFCTISGLLVPTYIRMCFADFGAGHLTCSIQNNANAAAVHALYLRPTCGSNNSDLISYIESEMNEWRAVSERL
ncbi:hypothetical protein FB451DRAFT_1162218 [Mycena latifolia]|nr:hypothetical protein FB451DRAFT_1162218 [Mycena latifolia]